MEKTKNIFGIIFDVIKIAVLGAIMIGLAVGLVVVLFAFGWAALIAVGLGGIGTAAASGSVTHVYKDHTTGL